MAVLLAIRHMTSAVLKNMPGGQIRQLCGLPQRTSTIVCPTRQSLLITLEFAQYGNTRSKFSTLFRNKNVQHVREYSSDQKSVHVGSRISRSTKLLLITSGAASLGYYIIKTRGKSDWNRNPWQVVITLGALAYWHTKAWVDLAGTYDFDTGI